MVRDATGILSALVKQNPIVGESFRVRSFRAGETVCAAHEMANSVSLVVRGRVQLYRTPKDGRCFVTATLGPGSLLGEACLLSGVDAPTHAVGLEPTTIWTMPRGAALELSASNAIFGFGLVQALGQRVIEAENRLEQAAFQTIPARLAALLLELSAADPGGVVRATHQQLADMLGTWRETISKTLLDFRRQKLVSYSRRRLVLLDREGLRKLSGAPACVGAFGLDHR